MKISFSRFCVLPFLLMTTASMADSGPEGAMEEFVTAFNNGDSAGVAAIFHEDGKLLPAGKPVVTGTQDIQAYWQGAFDAGVSHIVKTPIEIVINNDLAVATSSYIVTFKDSEIVGKDTLVWRKNADNEWKISTDIWNSDQ